MERVSYPPQLDSPSKQLMQDLARDLEQLRVHNSELKKVKAYERRSFYERLDRIDSELETQHYAALDQVAARHNRALEEAEETLRNHQREVEAEQRRKQEQARLEAERIQREKEERLRREKEEAARREAERKAAEEASKRAEEEAEKKRKAAQEEKQRKQREEEDRKRQADSQKANEEAARQRAEAEKKADAERQKRIGGTRLSQDEIKVQSRYVELHQHLKKFRQWLKDAGKSNPIVKQNMGDIRRSIKKCVGQLREGKGTNKGQLQEIRATLQKAAQITQPEVDVREFMAFPPENIANAFDTRVPALLIYGLNIFSKSLISSLLTEASINTGHAEPVGIVAAQIFSDDSFIYKGCPMVDILWAKYRVVCPALWGFYGDEKTVAGKRALGWWKESPEGPYISEQGHADRMTALGAGFAALTLRNFGKTTRMNPFPNNMFWHAVATILRIPTSEIQETHVILLAALLKSSAERIVGFWGQYGLALLRQAIVMLPNSLPRQSMGVNQLKLLRDLYRREKHIII